MIKSRYTSAVCILTVCLMLVITVLFTCGGSLGLTVSASTMPYESGLFATDRVHTMDIAVNDSDWQELLDNASSKEYIAVNLVIDGNSVKNAGLRTKGNSSLTSIVSSESDRYSFKVEFDHYVTAQTYQGLDKLALNNIAQDNTYLKDYICYRLMETFGADAPLCSFIYITVNGEEWGLYLAVEGIEESFAERNYGGSYGQIYKPDSMDMAGGMGGGGANMPDMSNMEDMFSSMLENGEMPDFSQFMQPGDGTGEAGDGMALPGGGGIDQAESDTGTDPSDESSAESGTKGNGPDTGTEGFTMPGGEWQGERGGGGMGGMGGSDDVALQYIDDEYDSYSNIFDNATFDISSSDKDRLIDSLKQLSSGENLEEIINIEEVLRYFVVHNFVLNFDSYTGSMTHNYYLYEDDGQLSMIAWDYNLAFGAFAMGSGSGGSEGGTDQATTLANFPIDTPVSGIEMEDRPMLYQLLSDETYLEQYHALFSEFIGTYFDEGLFYEIYENAYELIKPYVDKDPTSFCTYEEFETAADMLTEFCALRAESVSGQLDGTIPSRSEGQAEDSGSLVDASSIDISSMGSNSMGFHQARGGFGGDGQNTMQRPDMGTMPDGGIASEEAAPEDGSSSEGVTSSDTQDGSTASSLNTAEPLIAMSLNSGNSIGDRRTLLLATQGRAMTEGGTAGEPPTSGEMPEEMPPEGMESISGEGFPEEFARGDTQRDAAGQNSDAVPAETESSAESTQESNAAHTQDDAEGQQPDTEIDSGTQRGDAFNSQNFSDLMGSGGTATTQSSQMEQYIWLGVSVLLLAAGLTVAKLYRV